MKEVEFINSRVEEGRSQPSTDDYLPTTGTTTGASQPTGRVSSSFTHDERKAILLVLKNSIDSLTLYRFTIDNEIDHENVNKIVHDQNLRQLEHCFYVISFFEDLIQDLEINGSYNVLIREIQDKREIQNDKVAVARTYTEARKRAAELRKLVEVVKKENARNREEPKAQLIRSKNEKKRLELKVGIESRYVRAWEKARCEDISFRCGIALKSLKDELENLSFKEKNECRVNTEIEAFLQQNVKANAEAASQWQERCEREIKMYQSGNERLKNEIEDRRQELEKLRIKYSERQEFIQRYLEEKKATMERMKNEEHRQCCSIRIQAWWRGIMVRRKLGPYRPDEKKKKRAVKSKK